MWYGAAYYPEHWPVERWATDARLMRQAGFNIVRLGEFAWARMEPDEERFDFAWLDHAIGVLQAEGIAVLLGTPTAGPPAWLVNGAEECRIVYEEQGRWQFGGRSLCCVNHPRFRERSRRIAQALGERYASHPAVMGFQVDNELGMYGSRCHCSACQAGFRQWLRRRFGTIEALNERLGMAFGGGLFRSFDDIPFPRLRQDLHNPGLILESQRFVSESCADYVAMQAEALRRAGVRQPVTTNVCHMLSGWSGLDENALFRTLDVAGWDCYPVQFAPDPEPGLLAFLHAMARAYKRKSYWMLEQQSGSPMGMAADDPRRIRLWAWHSVAHGAEMLLYFRWRTCRFGGEQYWRGILDHDGRPNARYEVVARVGEEVSRLGGTLARVTRRNEAAVLLDFDACQSFFHNHYGARLDYRGHAAPLFAALQRTLGGADVVYEPPEPAAYRILAAPALRLMDPEWAGRLRAFVEAGGTLVATICTATLNRDHVAPEEPVPWLLTDLFGARRVEWSALGRLAVPPKERLGEDAAAWAGLNRAGAVPVVAEGGPLAGKYAADTWCDHLRAAGAEVLARFAAGTPAAGLPAVTVHRFGAGRALYVAAAMGPDFYERLFAWLAGERDPLPVSESDGVEVVRCALDGRPLFCLLNHAPEPAVVHLPSPVRELLSGTPAAAELTLEPYGVAVAVEAAQEAIAVRHRTPDTAS